MTVVASWLRHGFRHRWLSLVVLGLLVAVATTMVLTASAGARRGESAVDRLLSITEPATAVVLPNQPGFDWAAVRKLPEVEAVTTFPAYTSLTFAGIGDGGLTAFVPADSEAMRTIERPVVLEGRLADPARADEAVITPDFVATSGKGVGDSLTMELLTPAQADANFVAGEVGAPAGPRVQLRIVGVVRSFWYVDGVGGPGSVIPSPGVVDRYRANLLGSSDGAPLNALVRLRQGERDLPGFRRHLSSVSGRPDIDVLDRGDAARHARDVIAFESECLLAFGLAVLLAAAVVIGQVLARHAASVVPELHTLRALGVTARQAVMCGAAGPGAAVVTGTAAGALGAVVASRWLPFGAAANLEPKPGVDIDWLVLGIGGLLIALVGIGAAAAALRRGLAMAGRPMLGRRSSLAGACASAGAPVPLVVGVAFALDTTSSDSRQVPAALLGAITGVAGLVAALTFSAGVTDAATHPERFGQDYQLEVIFGVDGQDFAPSGPALDSLAAEPDVAGINDLRVGAGRSGAISVLTHTYDPVRTPVPIVLTSGAAPAGDDEVVLAPATAVQLGAEVGGSVPVTGDVGTRQLRVTGIGFAVESSTSDYDHGAWVNRPGYDRLFTGFKEHSALIALRPGIDPTAVIRNLHASPTEIVQNLLVIAPFLPQQIGEIKNVRVLPTVLGAFLSLLALATIAHTLATGIRRRSGDLAVLRAVGMTTRHCHLIVNTQATVISAIGLLVGVPTGLAMGRVLWRVAADQTPLRYQAPQTALLVALVIPVALIIANLLAIWPGARAARLRLDQYARAS